MCNTNSYGERGSRMLLEQAKNMIFSEAAVIAGYAAVQQYYTCGQYTNCVYT